MLAPLRHIGWSNDVRFRGYTGWLAEDQKMELGRVRSRWEDWKSSAEGQNDAKTDLFPLSLQRYNAPHVSLDHLIGLREQYRWNCDPERLGSFPIYH